MTVAVTHPQGMVREIPESKVDAYLALGWERAPEPEPPLPSTSWKRDELVEHAKSLGVDIPNGATKREVLDAINQLEEPGSE